MRKNYSMILSVVGLLVAGMGTAYATGGCVDSPENPTLVLALLGSASAGLPWLRARLASRRNPAVRED